MKGVLRTDRQTDICDCRVAFATENYQFQLTEDDDDDGDGIDDEDEDLDGDGIANKGNSFVLIFFAHSLQNYLR